MSNIFKDKIIKPMLLKEEEKPFDDKNYIYEIKFDGNRALIFTDGKSITIKSRNGNDLTNTFPELKDIKKLVNKKIIFDGEIILLDNGYPSFTKLQKRARLKDQNKIKYESINNKVIYIVFDILYENKDLSNYPLIERKEILNKYKDTDIFIKSKYFYKDGIKLFNVIKKLNLEGIVAKKIDSKYYYDFRTKDWIKIKNIKKGSFFIGGYIINKESLSLLLGEYRNKEFCYIGKVKIHNKYLSIIDKKKDINYFINYNNNEAIFIKPKIKVNIDFLERTKNNNLRHPVFRGFEK